MELELNHNSVMVHVEQGYCFSEHSIAAVNKKHCQNKTQGNDKSSDKPSIC